MEQGTLQHRTRVAVYCRVAADSEDQPNSRAAQKVYYIQKVGQNPDWELAGTLANMR